MALKVLSPEAGIEGKAIAGPLAGAASLAEDAEVIEVDKPLALSELIEDELLLAMPMIPMHEFEACPAREHGAVKRGTTNPFAALKQRKPTER